MSTSALPLPSAALSERLEAIASRYLIERYTGPGNPMQTQVLRIGSVTATKVPFVAKNPLMNAVHGLEREDDVPGILAFYAETQQPCWIGLAPHAKQSLVHALIAHGFKPRAHKAVLCAALPLPSALPKSDVSVQSVEADQLGLFLDTLNRGFDVPDSALAGLRSNQAFWRDIQHWRLYLASLRGEVAGAAVLATSDGLGYLAAGSTLPAFRGRGVHGALIARRIADAAAATCELVTGQADFASASHRNQERAGMRLAHVRQDWSNG